MFSPFDAADFFVFFGTGMLWYGLNLRSPWIAYTVCGGVIAAFGFFAAFKKGAN